MSLRDAMPLTAAFIDSMREAFGADVIDAAIRSGMRGQGRFRATEGGRTVGSWDEGGTVVEVGEMVIERPVDNQKGRR